MEKIEFYKNEQLIEIEPNTVKYLSNEKKIIRETSEAIIELDFKTKSCSFKLKTENITLTIPTIIMEYLEEENNTKFIYKLESEPDAENTIIVKKIDA